MEVAEANRSTGTLRPIGGTEHFFWLANQILPVHGSFVTEIRGTTSVAQWREALDVVQARHPLLSVSVVEDAASVLHFRHTDAPIPMRVLAYDSTVDWRTEVEEELSVPFDARNGPLIRALLIHRSDGAILILSSHHSISDAKSMAFAVQDVLQVLAGRKLEPRPMLPSLEALLGLAPATSTAVTKAGGISPQAAARLPPARVDIATLSEDATASLTERARREGTSVHGALSVAMTAAGRALFEPWRERVVRLVSPVDIRARLRVADDFGLFVGATMVPFEPVVVESREAFWEAARLTKKQLKAQATIEGALHHAAALHHELQCPDLPSAAAALAARFSCEALLTNLGRLPVPVIYGDIHLVAMWPFVMVDLGGHAQVISANTLDGRLRLAHTSRSPIRHLLAAVTDLLEHVCAT